MIAVCKNCHLRLHTTHGVGSAKGDKLYGPTKTKYLVELAFTRAQKLNQTITDVLTHQPIYTDVIVNEQGRSMIVRTETHSILNLLSCQCGDNAWQLLGDPEDGRQFLRCPRCGCDYELLDLNVRREKPQ